MSLTSHSHIVKTILLVHFGTPESISTKDIYRFLVEIFDRLHEEHPSIIRAALTRAIFAPLALSSTQKRYQEILKSDGFPLMQHCQKLVSDLNSLFGSECVFLAMQHGNPSIEEVCQRLKNHRPEKIIIMPLYPQRIPDMTHSIYLRAHRSLIHAKTEALEIFLEDFHLEDWYIDSIVETLIKQPKGYQAILFSYHAVPEKQGDFYKQQCQETTEKIIERSGLDIPWAVGFQSKMRFGRWLQPESRDLLVEFAQKGIKNLLVAAPGFITPCSETIIDIEKDLRELFLLNGGERIDLLPPLCSQKCFIERLSKYLAIL